jgi:hypothetical protein
MSDTRELGLIPKGGVLDTDTGEVFPTVKDAPTRVLVRTLGKIQASIDQNLAHLYEAKRALGGELIERMDRQAHWTAREPGVEIKAPSPSAGTVSWNGEKLEEILGILVEEGVIDREAKLRAVWPEVVYKTDARAITALGKLAGVEERIAPARIFTPSTDRKASVRVDPRVLFAPLPEEPK